MSAPDDESEETIASDVVPPAVALAIPEPLSDLLPWHRARKQAVREFQWAKLTRWLLERLKEDNEFGPDQCGGEVRLLTLPGRDYLDVRVLASVAADLGCSLTSVGFLAETDTSAQSARASLRETQLVQSGVISQRSTTWRMPIEQISRVNGPAYRNAMRFAPFHVVNFDACGSLAAPNSTHSSRLIDAVFRIVEMQLSRARHRWLLYLTTSVRVQDVSVDAVASLSRAIWQNAMDNPRFHALAKERFGELNPDEAPAGVAGGGELFLKFFSVGIGKWLMHLAAERLWALKMHRGYCYGDDASPYATMPCLAFEFVPPPPGLTDKHQLTRQSPAPGGTTEDLSMRVLEKCDDIENLDHKLSADPNLRGQLAEAARALLREAGYDEAVLANLA